MKHFLILIAAVAMLLGAVITRVEPSQAANLSYLDMTVSSPTATFPLDRYLHYTLPIKNTDSKAHTVSFTIRVKETSQDINGWPQPQTLYFEPGETLYLKTFMDENWGKIDKSDYGDHTRTMEITFSESGSTRKETVTYKYSVLKDADVTGDKTIKGKVVDTNGKAAANATVTLSTGNFSKTATAGSDGSFSFTKMPERSDWMLKATSGGSANSSGQGVQPGNPGQPGSTQPSGTQPGQNCAPPPAPCNPPEGSEAPASQGPSTLNLIPQAHAEESKDAVGYAFVESGKTDYTIMLKPASFLGSYETSSTVKGKIGYWKGDVDENEQLVLVVNGMENWQDANLKDDSKLELYTIDGEKKWEYAMGWEAWGADLSKDGKYAAFATSNSTKTLGVIDTATGKAVWTKTGKEFGSGVKLSSSGEGGGVDSKEITISNTNKYVGVGHGGGNVFLAELTTGKVLWNQDLKGQVRGILFDKDDTHMYAGSGDGNAYKLKIEDGSVVWKTNIGSWPFTNGFKLSADGKYLGSASKFGEVTVIDTATGKRLWQTDQLGNASLFSFSPDGKYVFAGGGGSGASTLYETTTGKKLWRLDRFAHQGMFSGDGKYIMIGDTNVDFYDLAGNRVGGVTTTGENTAPSQGQFAYITKDGSKVVFTRRDMTSEGNALIFAKGKMTALSTTDAAAAVTATAATEEKNTTKSSLPILLSTLAGLVVAAGGVAYFIIQHKKQSV